MSDPSLAVIISVAHPDHEAIKSYAIVERVLRSVIASHLGQKAARVNVVVVCHRIPDFAPQMDDRVHFVDVSASPEFAAGRNLVGVDKGMKYLTGILFAAERFQPQFVMLADADDFVRRDMLRSLVKLETPDNDGFVIKRGYHALMSAQPDKILLKGVFQVKAFDTGCGSCRVFRTAALLEKLITFNDAQFDQDAFEIGDTPQVVRPKTPLIERIDVLALKRPFERNIIHGIGRHTGQDRFFDFTETNRPLAAKGCGHNNHVGPKKGDVHWRRITKINRRTTFVEKFSLGDLMTYSGPLNGIAIVRASWRLFQRRLMRMRNAFR